MKLLTVGCIKSSRGALVRRRECKIPKPAVSAVQCQGPTTEVQLCDNFATCETSEISATEYAKAMCKDYKNRLPSLQRGLTGEGKQPAYNPQRVEQVHVTSIEAVSHAAPRSVEFNRKIDDDITFPFMLDATTQLTTSIKGFYHH